MTIDQLFICETSVPSSLSPFGIKCQQENTLGLPLFSYCLWQHYETSILVEVLEHPRYYHLLADPFSLWNIDVANCFIFDRIDLLSMYLKRIWLKHYRDIRLIHLCPPTTELNLWYLAKSDVAMSILLTQNYPFECVSSSQ